jgi:16S rRNA C1402 (ribose-2'-O) methylase RsmI
MRVVHQHAKKKTFKQIHLKVQIPNNTVLNITSAGIPNVLDSGAKLPIKLTTVLRLVPLGS